MNKGKTETGMGDGKGDGNGGPAQESQPSFSQIKDMPGAQQAFRPRLCAMKVPISDITNGVWVFHGMEGSECVITPLGERVSRVHIMGIVVDDFVNPEGSYATLTIDDSTSTIRLKAWEDFAARLGSTQKGSLVDIVGRVRRFQGETYIVPETLAAVPDARQEYLRKLELLEKRRHLQNAKKLVLDLLRDEFAEDPQGLVNHASEKLGIKRNLVDGIITFEEESKRKNEQEANAIHTERVVDIEEQTADKPDQIVDELKKKVLKLLESKPQGAEYSQLFGALEGASSNDLDAAIEALSDEGEIFEPRSGTFKRLL